jgi:hypothetical protein
VQDIAARLRTMGPVLAAKVRAGSVEVYGATFSLKSGKVSLVPNEGD